MLSGGEELANVHWWQDEFVYFKVFALAILFAFTVSLAIPWILEINKDDKDTDKNDKDKILIKWGWRLTALVAFGWVVALISCPPSTAGEWGDFIGGFFAGPALVWFVIAVFLQKKELEEQRKETTRLADESAQQTSALIIQSEIQAREFIERKFNQLDFGKVRKDVANVARLIKKKIVQNSNLDDESDIIYISFDKKNNYFLVNAKNDVKFNFEYDGTVYFNEMGISFITLKYSLSSVLSFAKKTRNEDLVFAEFTNRNFFSKEFYVVEYLLWSR